MVLSEVALYRYELPLTRPLHLAGDSWSHRRGLLVRLRTKQGAIGWGDAAPLPGFSVEALTDIGAHARSVAPRWPGTRIPEAKGTLHRLLRSLSDGSALPAALRFATESALVELLAATRGSNPAVVLGEPRATVDLNALITTPIEDGPEQARRYREQGYRAVKVKVGREGGEREAEALREIRGALGDSVSLRLDANRAWALEEAVAFAEATRDVEISYIEEPLADPAQLSELVTKTNLPVALDETTREAGPEILQNDVPVSAVVLKPTLLGGLRTTLRWNEAAWESGTTTVISSAYESGVGLRMLVALSSLGPDAPVGLSTYDRLATDVLRQRLPIDGPTIDVGSVVNAPVFIAEDRLALLDVFSA